MLALSCDTKSRFFKCLNRHQMIDARNFRQLDRNLDFPDIGSCQLFVQDLKILFYSDFDVSKSFKFSITL